MHLSANEIDVGFQYRYANQVNIRLLIYHIRSDAELVFSFSIRKPFVLLPVV